MKWSGWAVTPTALRNALGEPADVRQLPLPPVRLHPEAELARDALSTPLLARAARLARWAGPDTRVDAGEAWSKSSCRPPPRCSA